MSGQPLRYEPPPEHDQHLRGMIRFLIICFAALTIIVAIVVLNAQTLARYLPFSAEVRFADGIESSFSSFVDDTRREEQILVERYLQSLANNLSTSMALPDDYEITVHFVRSAEANAFATIGGHVFVFSGLIDMLPDENSLAMVLAHEIAHIAHRDPLASIGRGLALQIVYSFLTGRQSGSTDIATLGGNVGLMFFSREQEQRADLAAIEALQTSYGHVAGNETLFRLLADQSAEDAEPTLPAWLLTHPQLEERIDSLRTLADERGWTTGIPRHIPAEVTTALRSMQPETTTP